MLKELRASWVEDQYQFLGQGKTDSLFFFGRRKGEQYLVYQKRPNDLSRKLIQKVSLSQDWYWCPRKEQLVRRCQCKIKRPIYRTEHILSGISWGLGNNSNRLADLTDSFQELQFTLPNGAHAIVLNPKGDRFQQKDKQTRRWLLSLHGGPESFESTEIRYGGLYRELLKNGWSIVILNYRGSAKLASGVSKGIWGFWKRAIIDDYSLLRQSLHKCDLQQPPSAVLGGSFGGALALILQNKFKISKTLLTSPLLDLRQQEQRASKCEKKWFCSRFSSRDYRDFSFTQLTQDRRTPATRRTAKLNEMSSLKTIVLYSLQDEILGSEPFLRLENVFLQSKKEKRTNQMRYSQNFSGQDQRWHLIRVEGGHAPKTYLEVRHQFKI